MSQEKELIIETIDDIRGTVELFYQQKQKEALGRLEATIGKITIAVDTLFAYKGANDGFEMDEEKLRDSLKECMGALEESDFILMADILQYDFAEYMEKLTEQMN